MRRYIISDANQAAPDLIKGKPKVDPSLEGIQSEGHGDNKMIYSLRDDKFPSWGKVSIRGLL